MGAGTLYGEGLHVCKPFLRAGSDDTSTQGECNVFNEVFCSPLAMPALALPDSINSPEGSVGPQALLLPCSPGRIPQASIPASPGQHGPVHRCLFSIDAEKAFSALPRLIVPAAPFSSNSWGCPMQLPTPPAITEPSLVRNTPKQLRKPQCNVETEQQSMEQWLAAMELKIPGSRAGRGTNSSSSSSPTATGASTDGEESVGGDLPLPAFTLLGLLP
jgi:hypothetical protein